MFKKLFQKKFYYVVLFLMVIGLSKLFSAIPQQINYQGRLLDNGNPKDGLVSMEFSFYDASTSGNKIGTYTETHNVNVSSGIFSVNIGSITAIPVSIFNGTTVYINVHIGSDDLLPRPRVTASGYAYNAEKLGGYEYTAFVDTWTNQIAIGGEKTFTDKIYFSSTTKISGQLGIGVEPNLTRSIYISQNFSPAAGTGAFGIRSEVTRTTGASGYTGIHNFYSKPTINASGATVDHVSHLEMVDTTVTAGTLTNQYGIYVPNMKAASNNYSIYTGSATTYLGGNVGIGTTSPQSKLSVVGDISASGTITGSTATFSGDVAIGTAAPTGYGDNTKRQLTIYDARTGRVGVSLVTNVATAGEPIGILGFVSGTYTGGTPGRQGAARILGLLGNDSNSASLRFDTANSGGATGRMVISQEGYVGISSSTPGHLLSVGNGNPGAYCDGAAWVDGTSSREIKSNIASFNVPQILSVLKRISVKKYQYKKEILTRDDEGKIISSELVEPNADAPEYIGYILDEVPEELKGNIIYKDGRIDMKRIFSFFVLVTQEQQKKIEELENRIKALESK